jgi:hypothetical protein
MLSFSHTIISLALIGYFKNPLLIFGAAFVLHLLMDTFPHWNIYPTQFKRYPYALVALDICAGLFGAWAILGDNIFSLSALAAIGGGNAPDVLHGLWDMIEKQHQDKYFSWIKPAFVFHDKLQLETVKILPGMLWQILWLVISVVAVVHY